MCPTSSGQLPTSTWSSTLVYMPRAPPEYQSSPGSPEVGSGELWGENGPFCPIHFTEAETGPQRCRDLSKVTRQVDHEAWARALTPAILSSAPCLAHRRVPSQPWTPTLGKGTLTRTRRHPARSHPTSPAHSCSPSATPLSWDVSTGRQEWRGSEEEPQQSLLGKGQEAQGMAQQ